LLGECAAEASNGILPSLTRRKGTGDGVVTQACIALLVRSEEGEKLVKAERFFRVSAKVPLVTRQSSPLASLSIVSL
jgi:hypothetical protein